MHARRIFAVLSAVLTASVLVSPAVAPDARAETRRALVIGNDAYRTLPRLEKAVNDALAVSDKLERLGFAVSTHADLGEREATLAISAFARSLAPGDTAFFFYAGHGVEIDGENFLLPVDVPEATAEDQALIKRESLPLSGILAELRESGAALTIAVIDACRDNPFETAYGRSIGGRKGLAMTVPPEGSFIIYSAGAGQVALDRLSDEDADPNSVFTRKLLPLMEEPDLPLPELARRLRTEVRALSQQVGHRQRPAYYDEMIGNFALVRGAPEVPAEAGPPAAEPAAAVDAAPAPAGAAVPDEPGTRTAATAAEAPEAAAPERRTEPLPPIEEAFQAARQANSIEGWQNFLTAYGGTGHFYLQLGQDALRVLEVRQSF
ncbi:hypothetical protein LNKW23_29840 [Paralimibaculum aggregatum]|uniref:Caspase family p20 domain-containing protein n=1 Tax=Paralimibaculum aggregatum TaxID=3036245 RepID=A0ABQ6LRJ1_9RHOB|nr:caspase family protein [Limibaculum sp. NKW23]GMG83770.1 hypothetical protein LNKW23_29840 [Limibaculum sp. NKW23]